MAADDVVDSLAGAGLLTERQAEIYVLREIEQTPREATAERLGVSVNTVDNTLSTARRKVAAAAQTMVAVDSAKQAAKEAEIYVFDHKNNRRLTRQFDSIDDAKHWVSDNQEPCEAVEHGNRYEAVDNRSLL